MPLRLLRYVFGQYLKTFAVVLGAIVGIFLVIDFADRAHHYTGPGVVRDVLLLYGFKALVVAYQLMPAALLLAGGACMSTLRRRGEITAIGALAVSPVVVFGGVMLGAFMAVVVAIAFDEAPVRPQSQEQSILGWAGRNVDMLTATRFRQWGDFSLYYGPKQWFRGKNRIYFLRQGSGGAFLDVSIFELTPDFRLASRVDAARMEPMPDGSWRLLDGSERRFLGPAQSSRLPFTEMHTRFPENPATFQLRQGRPEQMTMPQLREEVARRERLGLESTGYALALQNKLAYPMLGLPATLLAAALALRKNRKGHLTAALLEGVAVVGVLWCANALFRAAASAGHLSPAEAAWAPVALLVAVAVGAIALFD